MFTVCALLEAMLMPISQLCCCEEPNCYESPALRPGSMVISVIHADTGYDVDAYGLFSLPNQCGTYDPTECKWEKDTFAIVFMTVDSQLRKGDIKGFYANPYLYHTN